MSNLIFWHNGALCRIEQTTKRIGVRPSSRSGPDRRCHGRADHVKKQHFLNLSLPTTSNQKHQMRPEGGQRAQRAYRWDPLTALNYYPFSVCLIMPSTPRQIEPQAVQAPLEDISEAVKLTCDRLNWKKWPQSRALSPLGGAYTSPLANFESEAGLLTNNESPFGQHLYRPTWSQC
jgi:hypothetical protein